MTSSEQPSAGDQAARRAAIAKAVERYGHLSGLYGCYVVDAATNQLNPRQIRLQKVDNGLRVTLDTGDDALPNGAKRALAAAGFVGYERTFAWDDVPPDTSLAELLDRLMIAMGAGDDYEVRCDIVDHTM
jgi:hypothetical protein